MKEPEIDLLSLPDHLTLQILKELDWKSLMNLKLVCRDFYFLIEKNIGNLDRPKISSLKINFDNGEIQHLHYQFKTSDSFNFESEWKHYVPKDEEQYNRFLKERDFTEIEKLSFFYNEINERVWVSELNQHENEFYGYLFNIYEDNYDNVIEMSDITIEMSSNRDRRMLWYDPYTKLYVLEEMASLGNNRSKIIAVNFVMDYLTGSPSFGFDSDLIVSEGPLQRDIAAYLLEYGYFDFKGRCSREKIKFNFYQNNDSFILETDFYKELFGEIKFKNNLVEINDDDDSFSIETAMDCRICRTRHINRVSFSQFEGIIEII
uniref:F-box domain-containing protein n=1 Tax=Strongyloides venezuelensis TaxID=75913 RepID=A0A0K0G470_STRVS